MKVTIRSIVNCPGKEKGKSENSRVTFNAVELNEDHMNNNRVELGVDRRCRNI